MRRIVPRSIFNSERWSTPITDEDMRKQIVLDYMYLQAKTPSTKYNNIVLCAFKVIQTILSVACLGVHIYSYVDKDVPMPHNTLFCATYQGYAIVSSGLIIGYWVGRRASPVMDLCICLMGGVMYNISGLLSLVYARNQAYKLVNEAFYVVHREFLYCCVAQCIISTMAGCMYWIDFFINLDVYQGMRRRRRNLALDDVIGSLTNIDSGELQTVLSRVGSLSEKDEPMTALQRSLSMNISHMIKEEEAEQERKKKKTLITDEDDLELHCICIEGFYFCKNSLTNLFKKKTYKRRFRRRQPDPEYDIEEFLVLDKFYREHDARFNAYVGQPGATLSQNYYVSRVRM